MLQNVPAMLDCVLAKITMQFTDGRIHTESIDLDSDSFDVVSEIEYMLYRYQQDGIRNKHDLEAWVDLCLGGTGCVYPTDEQEEAAETVTAIFDTYATDKNIDLDGYQVVMVDHQGNEMPYQIERQ
ncbi:hypothetical protein D3C75_498150 [compost metagenome]